MTIKGRFLDSESQEPIEAVSVVVIGPDKRILGPGTTSDTQGNFEFTSSLLDASGNRIQFSHTEYETLDFSPNSVSGDIEMYRDAGGDLSGVMVVFRKVKNEVKKGNFTAPIVMASAAVLIGGIALYMKLRK